MIRYFFPAIIWALIVLFLTLTPGQFFPKVDYWSITSLDKYIHFGIFFIQVWLLLWGEKRRKDHLAMHNYIIPFMLGTIFGIAIEYIQIMVPHRSFDVEDMIANSIGAALGAITFAIAIKIRRKKRNSVF